MSTSSDTSTPEKRPPTRSSAPALSNKVPKAVWFLAAGVFTMVTSELMAGGLLPAISENLGVSLGAVSLLISGFAAGQVFGPWLLGLPLARFKPRTSLSILLVVFAIAQAIGVLSPWPVLMSMRVVTGFVMSAFFSVAISTTTRIVQSQVQPRALAAVFNGATIGTTLGLPLATFAGTIMSWRAGFLLDSALVLLVAVVVFVSFPHIDGVESTSFTSLLKPLANRSVWRIFATSAFVLGGTLMAFAFFSTILQQETHVDPRVTPWMLALFGLANIVGMTVVGRITQTGATRVIVIGLIVMVVALLLLHTFAQSIWIALLGLVLLGLSGTSLNPALTERTLEIGGKSPAVVAMMPTIMTFGILLGTTLGGLIVDSPLGVRGPLLISAAFAIFALLTLIPDMKRRKLTEAAPAKSH